MKDIVAIPKQLYVFGLLDLVMIVLKILCVVRITTIKKPMIFQYRILNQTKTVLEPTERFT